MNCVKKDKMVGIFLGILFASSVLGLLARAPPTPKTITYTGPAKGVILRFIDRYWLVPADANTEGLPVVGTRGEYKEIAVYDVNGLLRKMRENGIAIAWRDALVEVQTPEGEANVYAYVLATHDVNDIVTLYVDIGRGYAYGMESLG